MINVVLFKVFQSMFIIMTKTNIFPMWWLEWPRLHHQLYNQVKNIIPDYVPGNNFNIPSANLCYFCFESMENCRNARSVLHGFLITLQLQQGDLKTATNTYEKHWNVFLFLESQAPTDMNRYYSEQLCHMECNSTAKLTCLPSILTRWQTFENDSKDVCS
jgi:hypothetical protein